jgi:hypothetical protein
MVDKADGHNGYNKVAKYSKKQECVRLTKEGRRREKT